MTAVQHDLGLRPRSSSQALLRVPSTSGSLTIPSQSLGSSSTSFDFSLKSSLSSAPTSTAQSEPAPNKVFISMQASRSPLVPHIATPLKAESVDNWLSSNNAPSSRTVVQAEGSAQSAPEIFIEDIPSMASVAAVELERPMPAADLQDLMSIGLGSVQRLLEVSEDKTRFSPLASGLGALSTTPSTPKCLTARGSGYGVDLAAPTPADTFPQESVMAETATTILTSLPLPGPPANGDASSAGIWFQHFFSSLKGIFHWGFATLLLALVAFLVAKRQCACDARHMLKALSRNISVPFIPAVVDAARSYSTIFMIICSLLVVLFVYVVWEILSCPQRRLLPILIEGKEFDVKVDTAGRNTMPNRMAKELRLKRYEASLVLVNPFNVPFPSKWAADAEVSLLGCKAKEMITFRIVSDVSPYPTVNRAFRDRHGLQSSKDKRYIYRACNAAGVIDYLGVIASGSTSHADDDFEWLNVQLTLLSGIRLDAIALLDTGSDIDGFSLSFVARNFPRGIYQECNKYIKCTANGHRVHVTKMIVTTIIIDGNEIERSFFILPGLLVDMILGDPFHVEHDPVTTMAAQKFLKPLPVSRAILASQYHCGMVNASKGTSWLLKITRKVRKQPAALPSAQLELALRRAENEEYTLQVNAAKRANALGDGVAKTEALRLEEVRRIAAVHNLEGMDRALRNTQAQEDGHHIAPLPAGPAPVPAPAPAPPIYAPAPNPAPAPVLDVVDAANQPAPAQAGEPTAPAVTLANAALDAPPPPREIQGPIFADPVMPVPAKAEPTDIDVANLEDTGILENVPANAGPDVLPPPTVYQAEDRVKDGMATPAILHNTEIPADTTNSDDSMYGGQEPLNAATMTTGAIGHAQTLVGSTSNVRNDSYAAGVHDTVSMPLTGDPATNSSNPETEGSSETQLESYRTGSSESPPYETSTEHTNGHVRGPSLKADTTATNDPIEDSIQTPNDPAALPAA